MTFSLITTAALIRDTFREAFARKIFWGLFGLSTAMILFFLFLLRIDLVEGGLAAVSAFGQFKVTRDVDRVVRGVYGGIAAFLYTWGMFLAVFASAGLIPSALAAWVGVRSSQATSSSASRSSGERESSAVRSSAIILSTSASSCAAMASVQSVWIRASV